jgi:hypothetical protein
MSLLLPLLGLISSPPSATAQPPVFAGPAFADGPYNTALGALGSKDKAIVSQEGIITRLYASEGARGMGARPVGESIRIVRLGASKEEQSKPSLQAAYDEALPEAPVHLLSATYADGVTLDVRAMQVDDGSGADGGFVFNVTARNTGSSEMTRRRLVDLTAGL